MTAWSRLGPGRRALQAEALRAGGQLALRLLQVLGVGHRQHDPRRAHLGEPFGLALVDPGHQMSEVQLERLRVAAGFLGTAGHLGAQRLQLLTGDAERLQAVAESPGTSRRGLAVTADVDRDRALPGGRAADRVLEGEELPRVRGRLAGPQGPQHRDLLIGAPTTGVEVGTAGFDLLTHPAHPDAQPEATAG